MTETGVIILAAGNSSRLGQPKQLLQFKEKSLIAKVTSEAIAAGLFPCVVVLGAYAELIRQEIFDPDILIAENDKWETGMASGIIAGMKVLLTIETQITNVIISVCDQPFISKEIFSGLVETHHRKAKGIVACSYGKTSGTPVLFNKKYFKALMLLEGEEGAKKLLRLYEQDVTHFPFKNGEIDIDTQSDYLNLLKIK
jgi:molybdenum cofactor cytidylyltransferase